MKTQKFFLVTILVLTTGLMAFSQKKTDSNVNEQLTAELLPQNLKLKDELQKYVVTTDHFNSDIFGNFFNKMRVKGEYTRGLENGKVKWSNCSVAMSMSRDAEFEQGTPLKYMEDFSYSVSEDMLKPENFTTFTEHSAFAKNLIWDMMAIEGFGWSAWDKLKLNEPYSAKDFNGKMDLAGQGSFENKDVILTWTGISKRNSENCAVIEFRTMNNPLEYSGDGMSMKGRSHYWGTIWVSLEDKQIEHAVLFEDVVMEMNLPGQTNKQIMDATREISFVKVI
ncbi:MAG: hypothetical protein FD181_456 [Prolixibacteraceae bacterium]|nr:MAG: hypothetical protein FD181_456 [Prolixibacteraceae bacterium]